MTTVVFSVWRDVGYTEGCLERPPKTSSLPEPDFQFEIKPSRQEMFSRARVEGDFFALRNVSYVRAEVRTREDEGGYMQNIYYGWVDDVSISSDNPDSPMCIIDWHIDYWRTFLPYATFGGGMVKRRPLLSTDNVPPQSYPHRLMEYTARYNVMVPADYWFVVFNFTYTDKEYSTSITTSVTENTDTGSKTTSTTTPSTETIASEVKWACYGVSMNSPNTAYTVSGGSGPAPSLNDTLSGVFDEIFGLDPSSIGGVWLSPVPPNNYGSGFSMPGWSANSKYCNGRCLIANSVTAFGQSYERSLLSTTQYPYTPMPYADGTTDEYTYTLTGFQGEAIGTLPWGIKVQYLHLSLVVSNESCYIRLWLARDSTQTLQSSMAEGLVFNYPCPQIGLSSNAWSSYLYSGAREAEIQQRRLQTEQTRDLGISATSTIGSGVTALTGSSLLGGIAGFLTGGHKQTLSSLAEYRVSEQYNDRFQAISDYSAANQTNTNLLPSGTFDVLRNGIGGIWLVKMTKDSYSLTQRANDIAMYGVNVSEPKTSCQTLIDTGGPLQITNLTVGGSIPPQAKNHFRNAFAGGVRIV